MNKKLLSASLGSWYFHLIYNPRAAGAGSRADSGRQSLAMLYLPPYMALGLGIGAGCQALAHFITLGNLTAYLLAALVSAITISFGARCAPGTLRRFCSAMRWPFVGMVLFFALTARANSLLPPESEGEGNSVVAVLVGLTTIISVAVVGARSGGRTVPLSAPLVPGLSLFGLLCLVSVDTVVQICFLVFVASALYLLAYERFLRRYIQEDQPVSDRRRSSKPGPAFTLLRPLPTTNSVAHWAAGALLVCSVWFAFFMAGGALFYYPVQAILPRLLAPQLSKVRAAAQGSLLDFRGSSSVMELRGGTYVLSDREMLRVTVHQGEAAGLWRGRVYDRYERSRWDEGESPGLSAVETRPSFWPRATTARPQQVTFPPLNPKLGQYEEVMEFVEPMDGVVAAVYSSGVPINMHSRSDFSTEDGMLDPMHVRTPYLVRSKVLVPRTVKLATAPGLTRADVRKLHANHPAQIAMQLPDDNGTRRTVAAIAQQIKLGSRQPLTTPYLKVRAISEYLIQNCQYSLRAPTVPANQDAVVFFLTQSREGACDMFASSMALLLREMDVPARIVTGYIQPESTPQNVRGTNERPTWIVRERDAHAWVEYYVPNLGWVTYDPTVGTRQVNESIPGQIAEFLALPTITIPPHLLVLPAAGMLLIVVGLMWTVYDRRSGTIKTNDPDEVERLRISRTYLGAVHDLRRRVPRQPYWTPVEYEERVSRSNISLAAKQEFAALTHLYMSAYYESTPPKLRTGDLESCRQRFRQGLKQKH